MKNKNLYSFFSGGAEFRLPILVGFFGFATLNAVIARLAGVDRNTVEKYL